MGLSSAACLSLCFRLLAIVAALSPSAAVVAATDVSSPPEGSKKAEAVTLWTAIGTIRGTREKSYRGRPFLSFRGIPYAKPPVGKLRFAPPEPAGRWDGVLDATRDAPLCIQKNYLLPGHPVMGQEDCLYLNVYVPLARQKPKVYSDVEPFNPLGSRRWWEERRGQQGSNNLLPVMIFVHGGGWFSGSGDSTVHGPEYLADRDVVLVTFNYRLGALGFLSTEDAAATGNWALKDQVLALKWVKDNIRSLGGDEGRVTLFGQSAGAASVHYHMLSTMSRGLFHRAVTQSGSALSLWAWPRANARALARRQGRLVGCENVDTAELIGCMREASAYNITESGAKLKVWSVDPLTLFTPVVEMECPDWPDEPFLTDHPLVLAAAGKFDRRVPWMVGVVPGEGVVRASAILSDPELVSDLNARLDSLGPFLFELDKSAMDANWALAPGADALWKSIASFYLSGSAPGGVAIPHVGEGTAQGFIDAYTDRGFLHSIHKAVQLHLNNSHLPIFFYEFTFRGSLSWSRLFAGNDKDNGVTHCDDLLYLFRAPAFFPDFKPDSPEMDTVDLMVTLWTNFAKFGDPTPRAIQGTAWPSVTPSSPHLHLDIGKSLEVKESLHEDRLTFWDSLALVENVLSSSWVPGAKTPSQLLQERLRPLFPVKCPAE